MQSALISVQSLCTEAQKSRCVPNCCESVRRLTRIVRRRFSDLFALAEDVESKPKRKSPSKKKIKAEEGNSDSEASEVSVSARRVFHNVHDSVI